MKSNHSNIKKAKKYLDNHNCIGVPTETVYGLAGNAYSNRAVKEIFHLKKRPKNNPLIVHYNDLSQLKNDCILNKDFNLLYKKFCPGPLTFVLKLKKKIKSFKICYKWHKDTCGKISKTKTAKKINWHSWLSVSSS